MTDFDAAQLLKALRRQKKVLAKTVADKLGVHASTITRIEAGAQPLSESVLQAYATTLRMDVDKIRVELRSKTRSFPLYDRLVEFSCAEIWPLDRTRTAQVKQPATPIRAGRRDVLADRLTDFVIGGTQRGRSLTMVFQLEPYHNHHVVEALTKAIEKGCSVFYASAAEPLDSFHSSHLFLKLRLALAAHQYAVRQGGKYKRGELIDPFQSKSISGGTLNFADGSGGALQYDLCHWSGHSVFVGMPTILGNQAGAGFIAEKTGEQATAAFASYTRLLETLNSDVRIFSHASELQFWKLMQAEENGVTERRSVQPIFNSLVRPPQLIDPATEELGCYDDSFEEDVSRAINEIRYQRTLLFRRGLGARKFRQVCDAKSIDQWVQEGRRPDLGPLASDRKNFEDVRIRLEATKDLLIRYPGFEIDISDNFRERWGKFGQVGDASETFSWAAVGPNRVILERKEKTKEFRETQIVIDNEAVHRAFVERFDDGWEGVKADENKKSVLARIDSWLENLQIRGY